MYLSPLFTIFYLTFSTLELLGLFMSRIPPFLFLLFSLPPSLLEFVREYGELPSLSLISADIGFWGEIIFYD